MISMDSSDGGCEVHGTSSIRMCSVHQEKVRAQAMCRVLGDLGKLAP